MHWYTARIIRAARGSESSQTPGEVTIMRQHRTRPIVRPSGPAAFSAVVLALVASLQGVAVGEDPAVAELTQPQSTVDGGSGLGSGDSYKFGGDNGLHNQGGVTVGSMDLYGGRAYD